MRAGGFNVLRAQPFLSLCIHIQIIGIADTVSTFYQHGIGAAAEQRVSRPQHVLS